jgi:hypothetical protein
LLPFIYIENESTNNVYYKWDEEGNNLITMEIEEFEVRTMLNKAY